MEDAIFVKDKERLPHADLRNSRIYTQFTQQIKPFVKLLEEQEVPEEILDPIYVLVHYCMMQEYRKANEIYMALCIGNSPWPMGVT